MQQRLAVDDLPQHFEKLPPAEKGRDGKFRKRARGEPFRLVNVVMPPPVIEAVYDLAEQAGEYPSTIWRLTGIREGVRNGRDLSNE
jgi:hypothetical protein